MSGLKPWQFGIGEGGASGRGSRPSPPAIVLFNPPGIKRLYFGGHEEDRVGERAGGGEIPGNRWESAT